MINKEIRLKAHAQQISESVYEVSTVQTETRQYTSRGEALRHIGRQRVLEAFGVLFYAPVGLAGTGVLGEQVIKMVQFQEISVERGIIGISLGALGAIGTLMSVIDFMKESAMLRAVKSTPPNPNNMLRFRS